MLVKWSLTFVVGTSTAAIAGIVADCCQLSAISCLVANFPAPMGAHSMPTGFGSLKVISNKQTVLR